MNRLIKIMFVLVLTFVVAITSVNAAKESTTATKNEQTTSTGKSKVTFYLFRRSGCSHCAEELVFLDKIYNDYKGKINFVVYDTTDGSNAQLLEDVAAALGVDVNGVPFAVIGKEHIEGFASQLESSFKELMDKAYDEQVDDVVAGVLDENVYSKKTESTDIFDAMKEEGLEITAKKSKQSNIVPIVVFSLIFLIVSAFIYYSRRN